MVVDFAQKLATAYRIIVDVSMWCTTAGANAIRRYRVFASGIDRLKILAVLRLVFFK